ncbi:MAG: hypothetical protein JWQ17_5483, partial [Tardiphaga sp.]|nr:hypothetical protein [Tardiphaga sp.]
MLQSDGSMATIFLDTSRKAGTTIP